MIFVNAFDLRLVSLFGGGKAGEENVSRDLYLLGLVRKKDLDGGGQRNAWKPSPYQEPLSGVVITF